MRLDANAGAGNASAGNCCFAWCTSMAIQPCVDEMSSANVKMRNLSTPSKIHCFFTIYSNSGSNDGGDDNNDSGDDDNDGGDGNVDDNDNDNGDDKTMMIDPVTFADGVEFPLLKHTQGKWPKGKKQLGYSSFWDQKVQARVFFGERGLGELKNFTMGLAAKGDSRNLLPQDWWRTVSSCEKVLPNTLACEFQDGKDDGGQPARPHNHHAHQDELCANGCASNTGLAGFIGVRHAPEATPAVVVILGKLQPETATKATTSQELLF